MDFADSNLHIGSGKVYLLVSKLLCCPLSNPKPVSFALRGVGFLVDPSKDCNQLVEFPDQKPQFSALDRSDSGFVEPKSRSPHRGA